MRIKIRTYGEEVIDTADLGVISDLREAIADPDKTGGKWQIANVIDSWRSNVYTSQDVTIMEDDGTVLWQGSFG